MGHALPWIYPRGLNEQCDLSRPGNGWPTCQPDSCLGERGLLDAERFQCGFGGRFPGGGHSKRKVCSECKKRQSLRWCTFFVHPGCAVIEISPRRTCPSGIGKFCAS